MKNFVILTLCSLLVVGVGVLVMAEVKGRPIVIESNKQLEGVDTEIEEILSYASLAPNSHNMCKAGTSGSMSTNKSCV